MCIHSVQYLRRPQYFQENSVQAGIRCQSMHRIIQAVAAASIVITSVVCYMWENDRNRFSLIWDLIYKTIQNIKIAHVKKKNQINNLNENNRGNWAVCLTRYLYLEIIIWKKKAYSLYENLIMRTYMGRNVMGNEHCACRKKENQDCQGNVRTTRKSRSAMKM